ncbi:MAG: DUF1697 domain-containing protein [Candidatus Omnitrophota bacterium]
MAEKIKTYIILLRGVMPVGKNKVPMARLREILADAGFRNVRTYIQSGNALVDTGLPPKEIEQRVHALIKKHIGAELTVVVRTGTQLQKVLDENPFDQNHDIARVFFVSFAGPPAAAKIKELCARDFSPEKLVITKNAGYMFIPGSSARSVLSNNFLEKKLGVSATTRNFNTMTRLVALSKEK